MPSTQEVRLPAVINERLLQIPDYQRPYAWRRKQLEDLWEDLDLLGPTGSHYAGTLVLRDVLMPDGSAKTSVSDDGATLKHCEVVDGQQRLTTEVLGAFSVFGRSDRLSLSDPSSTEGFVGAVNASLSESLADDALIHGMRTQALFEALVVSLGRILLIKQEDAGEAYAADESIQIPDFRIVLPEKSPFLVEVKNFHERAQPHKPFRMRDADLQALRRYGEIMQCEVKIAIYWSVWNLWALVPLYASSRQDDHQVSPLRMP